MEIVSSEIFEGFTILEVLSTVEKWILKNNNLIGIRDFVVNQDFEKDSWIVTIYYIVKG